MYHRMYIREMNVLLLSGLKLSKTTLKCHFTTNFLFFHTTSLFLFFTNLALKFISLSNCSNLDGKRNRLDFNSMENSNLLLLRKSFSHRQRLLWQHRFLQALNRVFVKRMQSSIFHSRFHHRRTWLFERSIRTNWNNRCATIIQ